MPKWDATNTNESNRTNRTFKDLDLDFGLNSVTKDVNKLTDAEAIKRSVRNLINTNNYERPFRPEIGSGIRGLLFEPMTENLRDAIAKNVTDIINYDPRVQVDQVTVDTYESGIMIECTLTYLSYNISESMRLKFDENSTVFA